MNETISANAAPPNLPRRKPSFLWWLAAIFLLLVALFCYQLFGPNPPIIVSKETTYITEPLRADGLPDYEKYVLDKLRDGVTPENNAAVVLWHVLGPGTLKRRHWPAMQKELGLDTSGLTDSRLVFLFSRENLELVRTWIDTKTSDVISPISTSDQSDSEDINIATEETIARATGTPWTTVQLPPLAEWAKSNQRSLDQLVEASRRSEFYIPPMSLLEPEDVDLLKPADNFSLARDVIRALSGRAMWHLGEGRHEHAWRDLLAAHRWVRLTSKNSTLLYQLVAEGMDNIVFQPTVALLADPHLPAQLASQIQRDLAALSPPIRFAESFDTLERLAFADQVVRGTSLGAATFLSSLEIPRDDAPDSLDLVSIDWNLVLLAGNEWYDKLVAALRLPTYSARMQAATNIEADLAQTERDLHDPAAWAGSAINRGKRSRLLARAILNQYGILTYCIKNADRAATHLELLRLAAALSVHRAEHGAYPETLDDLTPIVLPQLPVDLYNTKSFIYRPNGDGYLLYSVGGNGIDDGGGNEMMTILAGRSLDDVPTDKRDAEAAKIPTGADDLSIRVPRPAFELPKTAGAK